MAKQTSLLKLQVPEYVDEFVAFWRAYPARNGVKSAKWKAHEYWKRLDQEEKKRAMASLGVQVEHYLECKRRDLFVAEFPDAWRWIRDERYDDDVSELKEEETWKDRFLRGET